MLDRSGMIVYYHAHEQAPLREARASPPDDGGGHCLRAITRLTGHQPNHAPEALGGRWTGILGLSGPRCSSTSPASAYRSMRHGRFAMPSKRTLRRRSRPGRRWRYLDVGRAGRRHEASCVLYVGGRDSEAAMTFMDDLAPRLAIRVQLTSDGHRPYLEAIEGAFGGDIDYAMLVKVYGAAPEGQRRYSPADLHRRAQASRRRQSRPQAFQHVVCRAPKSQDPHGQSSHDEAHERLFKEGRKPRAYDGDLFHALQFRAHPSDVENHARDGGRGHLEALGNVRYGEGARGLGNSADVILSYI